MYFQPTAAFGPQMGLPNEPCAALAPHGSGPGSAAQWAASPWEGGGAGRHTHSWVAPMAVSCATQPFDGTQQGQCWDTAADESSGLQAVGCPAVGQGPLMPEFLHPGTGSWEGDASTAAKQVLGQPPLQPPMRGPRRRREPSGGDTLDAAGPRQAGRQVGTPAYWPAEETSLLGPKFCKLLVPNFVAGAIIGRDGVMIGEIEFASQCQVRVSAPGKYFPGTTDRICIIGGTMAALANCIDRVLRCLQDISPNSGRPLMVKLAVPNSAISGLIGHQGDAVKKLSGTTGCRINASPRVANFQERLVMIAGAYESLVKATMSVVQSIQSDPHLRQHLLISYDMQLPLGTWAGNKAQAADPTVPLINPSQIARYTKRELIEYLQKAAPQEILLRYSIFGSIKNTVKSKGTGELVAAVTETWEVRGGREVPEEGEVQEAVASVEEDAEEQRGGQDEEEVVERRMAGETAPASAQVQAAPGQAAPGAVPVAPGPVPPTLDFAQLALGHVPTVLVRPQPAEGPLPQSAPSPRQRWPLAPGPVAVALAPSGAQAVRPGAAPLAPVRSPGDGAAGAEDAGAAAPAGAPPRWDSPAGAASLEAAAAVPAAALLAAGSTGGDSEPMPVQLEPNRPEQEAVDAPVAASRAAPCLLESFLSAFGLLDEDSQQSDKHRRRCCQRGLFSNP